MSTTALQCRAGLVGAGYISEYHVAALRRLGNVDIVGVCDLDTARAQALADRCGLRVYPSPRALRDAGANTLHVLTPPHTHAAVAVEALELGCHVLVEKPLAVDVDDCRHIEEVAARRGLSVCVNHSLLFDPQVVRALDAVRAGRLGKVVSVDILRSSAYPPYAGGPLPPQYRTPGYPFRDLGVHALYLFEAFLGPIENVRADWASLGGDPNLAFDEWRAQVRCRDGIGQFQLSWNVKPLQSQIIIQGTRGVLRVDLFLMFHARRGTTPLPKAAERILNAMTDSFQPLVDVPRGVYRFLRKKVLPYHGLQDLVAAFYHSVRAGQPAPVGVGDATRVVRWTEEVARAADEDYARRTAGFKLSDEVSVLLTGASGALGGEVLHRLVDKGTRVRILVRRPPALVPPGVEVCLGNLGDPQAVDRAVRGVHTVIHAGATMKGGWPEHQGGTVVGTKNVLDACAKYGVRKLVYVSSLSVLHWLHGNRENVLTESAPLEPHPEERGAYTRAKLEAERLVTQFCQTHSLPTIILRPGQIFGGQIPVLSPAVARRMGARWIILGDGALRLPLVHMDRVADAVVAATAAEMPTGQIIHLVDADPMTQNEVLRLVQGADARIVHVPRAFLLAVGYCSQVALGLLKRQSPLAPYRLRSALNPCRFDSAHAPQFLPGWDATRSVRDGILRTSPVPSSPKPEWTPPSQGEPATHPQAQEALA